MMAAFPYEQRLDNLVTENIVITQGAHLCQIAQRRGYGRHDIFWIRRSGDTLRTVPFHPPWKSALDHKSAVPGRLIATSHRVRDNQ